MKERDHFRGWLEALRTLNFAVGGVLVALSLSLWFWHPQFPVTIVIPFFVVTFAGFGSGLIALSHFAPKHDWFPMSFSMRSIWTYVKQKEGDVIFIGGAIGFGVWLFAMISMQSLPDTANTTDFISAPELRPLLAIQGMMLIGGGALADAAIYWRDNPAPPERR